MPKVNHDSRKWEQAYEAYKKYVPKSKYNSLTPVVKKIVGLSKEPMLLQEEYNNILKEMRKLSRRRSQIKREMGKFGVSPIKRSQYFDRPILLYALKLRDNCWYVGMSRNVEKRFKSHQKGGTIWTKAHPPIEVVEVRETGLTSDSEASKLEDEMTFEYARKYGINFVRGGGCSQSKPHWPKDMYEPDLSWIR